MGISVLDEAGNFRTIGPAQGLAGPTIRTFYEDSQGRIWVGTDTGLSVYDGFSWRTWADSRQGLTSSFIRAVFEDRDGDIWVGTYGGGLCRFKDSQFKAVQVEQGLVHDVVFQISDDALDRLWIATHQAIYRVPRRDVIDVLEGRLGRIECEVFGDRNDILRVDYSGGVYPSAAVDRTGRMWFPTFTGVLSVDPMAERPRSEPPQVMLQAASTSSGQLTLGSAIELAPDETNLRIAYTALTFTAPKKVNFFTQLEGLEREWQPQGNSRTVQFSKLPAGKYRFRVKARNHAGQWSTNELSLDIRVAPHFYKTPLFAVMFGLLLFGLGMFLNQRRSRRAIEKRQELEHLVEQRTGQLTQTNQELEDVAMKLRESQDQLLTAAHRAGMAEVASDVLHNIGNYLNRLNVTHYVLKDKVQQIDDQSTHNLTNLLRDAKDRGELLTHDEVKAEKIVRLFERYFDGLGKVKQALIQEIDDLEQHVKLLGRVIHAQHEVAEGQSFTQAIDLAALIEDLLALQQEEFDDRQIEVIKDLQAKVRAVVPVQKITQVIQNVMRNAIDALMARDVDRKLELLLESDGQFARLTVSDNGVGLSPSQLEMAFRHGFTTKKKGLGFGLHYSANAMGDMGGSIDIQSDGHKQGARVLIRVPLRPIPAA